MIDNDVIFDALADSQRRQLLLDLLERGPQHVPELSTGTREMAEAHPGVLDDYLSSSRDIPGVSKALLRTHHVHLPKLSEDEFVRWDRAAGVVRKGRRFDELAPLLELLEDRDDDRPTAASVLAPRR